MTENTVHATYLSQLQHPSAQGVPAADGDR